MLQLDTLNLAELKRSAAHWNELWQRSDVRLPTKRAEGLKLWHQTFAPAAAMQVIIVIENSRWVAGLPLIEDRSRWPLTIYRLPANCTVSAGDFLLDPDCDVESATRLMAQYVSRLPGTIAVFDGIEIQAERWQRLLKNWSENGRAMHVGTGHEVGVVDILHDWEAYTRAWSGNHRSAVKRARKKLEAEGEVEVQRLRCASDDELDAVLQACFEIEDKGWKGANGTSILRTPGLADYYRREARILREAGMLDLWLLKLDRRIIAFEYCHLSQGTCFSHKISFDPDFNRYSPGQVLRSIQLEQYHQDPAVESLDTLGVLCEAKAKWVTRAYRSSRCYVAIGGAASNWLLRGAMWGRNWVQRLGRAREATPPIELGAKRVYERAGEIASSALAR